MEEKDIENNRIQQKRWFSWAMGKGVSPYPLPEERKLYNHHGILNRVFFAWIFHILKVGYKRTLEAVDLYYLPEDLKVEYIYRRFLANYTSRKARNQGIVTVYVVLWALFDTFKYQYSYATLALFLCDTGSLAMPLLSRKLIEFVGLREAGIELLPGKGIGYAFGSAFGTFATFLLANQYLYNSILTAVQIKAVLTRLLLEKAFKANWQSKHDYPTSQLTTFVAADLAKIEFGVRFAPLCLTFPLTLAICIGILAKYIGAPSAVGIGVIIVFTGMLIGLGIVMIKLRKKSLVFTDKRIKYIKEVVHNLKIIKMYSWEDYYSENISSTRKDETNELYKLQFIRNLLMAFAITVSVFASMLSFLVLYSTSSTRNAANTFSAVSLFGLLGFFITNIPLALSTTSDAFISLKRVSGFLNSGEMKRSDNITVFDPEAISELDTKTGAAVKAHGLFSWPKFDGESSKAFSMNIDIDIKQGELIIVTGSVGTGKSSFLSALSGFMPKDSGVVIINGSILLCSSTWVQNETVKQNILFGSHYDDKLYQQTIHACCLQEDLDQLPASDNTEVGERGITLSGGQKARINLARAVYNNYDIVLLDDVLSAVDAKVGKHIMEDCLLGHLKNKTRLLATHQLSYVHAADRIVFLNLDGTIQVGTAKELENNEEFMHLLGYTKQQTSDEPLDAIDVVEEEEEQNIPKVILKDHDATGKLIQDERRAVNTIPWAIYIKYFCIGAKPFPPVLLLFSVLLLMSLSTFTQLFTNTWLSFWTAHRFNISEGFYIGIYIACAFATVIFMVGEFSCYIHVTNRGSRFLHIRSVDNLLKTPMAYLDVTPIGRVLNRFTKDTDSLDNEIIEQIRLVSHSVTMVIGTIILCICYMPWFAIAVPFVVFIFVFVGSYYQASSREIKRLEAVQRSFVFNNFNESLSGMQTIQAFDNENRFLARNDYFVDNMNEANYLVNAAQRWLAMHLNTIAFLFVLAITLLCVNRVFNISAASTGLLLSYVVILPNLLTLIVQSYTQLENEMNSVERMCEFAFDLPQELQQLKTNEAIFPKGEITFSNVEMKYRAELPLTLRGISFTIKQGERVGIVGRTGAGKSSIVSALFRLSELTSGSISIDDTDISKLSLSQLRANLSIIPQETVLFAGTVAQNLDPFETLGQEELKKILATVGLTSSKFDLQAIVEDDGSNFSLGEKQLIAFARALVKRARVLILDEATSSVDYKTDSHIQSIIASQFNDKTILCIAHRLQTILTYDRILVMDDGYVKEFDSPWQLYIKGGLFRTLCDKAKINECDFNN